MSEIYNTTSDSIQVKSSIAKRLWPSPVQQSGNVPVRHQKYKGMVISTKGLGSSASLTRTNVLDKVTQRVAHTSVIQSKMFELNSMWLVIEGRLRKQVND